jgi:hypothetical protein
VKDAQNLPPYVSALELQQLADRELSLGARLGYVALLLVGLMGAGAIGSLWLTEPSLPLRTHVTFALLVAVGLAWAVFAWRVLTSRRILLARHRITAARMSVAFTGTFLLAALMIGYARGGSAAFTAAGMAAVMFVLALGMLIHAHRRFARLMQRREALARQLGTTV